MSSHINDSAIDFEALVAKPPADAQPVKATRKAPVKKASAESSGGLPDTPAALKKNLKEIEKVEKQLAKTASKEAAATSETEKSRLRIIISRYHGSKRFHEHLKSIGMLKTPAQLDKMSNDQLADYIRALNLAIDNKSANRFIDTVVHNGLKISEHTLHRVYCVDGLTSALEHDDDWLDALECFKLEHQDIVHVSPAARLGIIAVQTAIKVHTVGEYLRSKQVVFEAPTVEPTNQSLADDKPVEQN